MDLLTSLKINKADIESELVTMAGMEKQGAKSEYHHKLHVEKR